MRKNLCGLSKIEYEFMTYFWGLDRPVDFSEVVRHFQETEHVWAKTTIHTHLTHLINKGVLTYHLQGKRKLYYAALSEKELQQRYAEDFLADTFDGSLSNFISALTYHKDLSKSEIDDLENFINETLKPKS